MEHCNTLLRTDVARLLQRGRGLRSSTLPFLALLCLTLVTLEPVFAVEPSASQRAEYRRQTVELHKLAQREAWSGVERFYLSISAGAVEPSSADHVAAAHAAASRGEVHAVRDRLMSAHRLEEDREVVEWLWSIDTNFGEVEVVAAGGNPLTVERLPFDRSKAAAVAYAQDAIDSDDQFAGLLPAGRYLLGETVFVVEVGRCVSLDLDPRGRRARRVGRRGDS